MKKVYSTSERQQLSEQCAAWKKTGKKVVFTNGCFDGFHKGHHALLAFARELGEYLIVALNSDSSVRKLKGEERPFYPFSRRAKEILENSKADILVEFDEDTPAELIRRIHPDVLVKGGDYTPDTVIGADSVLSEGGEVRIFPRIPGYASSENNAKKKKQYK
jgi:rfaE bifunctional protein nucleotidyltransferase chain/domain